MSDPRERIETKNLGVELMMTEDDTVDKTAYWWLGANDIHEGVAQWPEVVELAQKILSANEAWLDANTPTLAKLRTKYPGFNFACDRVVCGPTYCDVAWVTLPDGTNEGNHFESEIAALRWLAAKLEELT